MNGLKSPIPFLAKIRWFRVQVNNLLRVFSAERQVHAIEFERNSPCLSVDPEERAEGCSVASAFDTQRVMSAAHNSSQLILIGVVPRLRIAIRLTATIVFILRVGDD